MRKLTQDEKLQAPGWAKYYSVSKKDAVFFVSEDKKQACSLDSPKLGVIELTKGSSVYNNLALIK